MGKTSLVALSLLTFLVGGCQLFGGGEPDVTEPTEATTPATTETATASPTPAPSESPEAFSEPTVSGNPPPPPTSIPSDLIASTSSNSRVQQIQGKGSDPFAPLSVVPVVTIPPAPPSSPVAVVPSSPSATAPNVPGRPGATASPSATPTPVPPPPPRTTEAKAVAVTGVVNVGSQVFAIVQAPNEPTSRYVQAGQSLSNGQVLVKRIDVNSAEPVVVLVQNGVEIVKTVGSPGATEEDGQANIAMNVPPN